jgi:hypothetical protein
MQPRQRLLACSLILTLACAGQITVLPQHGASAAAEQCFLETGFCVADPFLVYWREHGGLAING